MSPRPHVRAAVALVAIAQVAVPLAVLAQPERPARFGWQMYAGLVTPLEITVVRADGSERKVAPRAVIGRSRPELSYDARVADHVCRRFPEARAVSIRRTEPPLELETRCSST